MCGGVHSGQGRATGGPHRRGDGRWSELDVAFARVGIDDWSGLVEQNPEFMRPAEVDLLVGDPAKAKEVLGWKPKVGFTELVTMMVDADVAEQKSQR